MSRRKDNLSCCVSIQFGMYDDIADETGYADRTLRLVKETAEKIESGRRLPELSFSHHVEVASLPPSGSTRSTRMEQTGRAIKSR